MHPGATLFFDVGVQDDLWPGGAWPLMSAREAVNVPRLFDVARAWGVRQGGIVCRHCQGDLDPAHGVPSHATANASGLHRPPGCDPVLPMAVHGPHERPPLDRTMATYLATGCGSAPTAASWSSRAFGHLVAGVREAVVYGAGIEYGVARAVEALLARRIRTYVVVDATGAAVDEAGQLVVAAWKRRGVDVTTVATIARLLTAGRSA
jgi:hypothetical protein